MRQTRATEGMKLSRPFEGEVRFVYGEASQELSQSCRHRPRIRFGSQVYSKYCEWGSWADGGGVELKLQSRFILGMGDR